MFVTFVDKIKMFTVTYRTQTPYYISFNSFQYNKLYYTTIIVVIITYYITNYTR